MAHEQPPPSARVLIVDHDPDARYQSRGLATEAGLEVCGEAGLGTEAVALAVDAQPSLVLCALREPIARVERTIEALVQRLPGVPVIVHSDSSDVSLIRKAMVAGARDFVQAPLKPDELQRSVATVLAAKERGADTNGAHAASGATIAVFGAKGGIGKTTVAANLGVALARHAQQSTVLVDADDSFGDVAPTLALMPNGSTTEALRSLDDDDRVEQLLSHHSSGLAVLPAPETPFEWSGLSRGSLAELMQRLARRYDVVLVDTSGTLSETGLAALEAASLVLWLTTADYTSVRDSVQALQALHSRDLADDRFRLVLNMTGEEADIQPSSIEQALGRPIYWTIPYDGDLRRSAQLGRTLVDHPDPTSPAARSLRDLALALSGVAPAAARRPGLLERIVAKTNGALGSHETFRPPIVKKAVEQ